jgi:transposase InsO family protein
VSLVGHAANVHFDLACSNFGIQETRDFTQAEQDVFPGCPALKDGYYWANDKPGLGIDLDEKLAAKFPINDDPPFDMQPLQPHQDWHVDVRYLNIAGTFYFLCSILDGFSRFIVHGEIRDNMEDIDVQTILQRGREKFPGVTPRIISDNGPQFLAKDFKEFIRIAGMTHVRTWPDYPQSNGKIERWQKTLKGDCLRVQVPLSPDEARRIVADYVAHSNHVCLHSAIGYVPPHDRLLGHDDAIHAERDRKRAEARQCRKPMRQTRHEHSAARADASHPAIDVAAVRTALTIAQVFALLGFVSRSEHAGQQRGACPLHGSTHGTALCFSVNSQAHTFHGFPCGRSGNALDLGAAAQRLSIDDAAVNLCQRLNIPLPVLTSPRTGNREEKTVASGSNTCTIP